MHQSKFLDPKVIIELLPRVIATLFEREMVANKHKWVGFAERLSKIPVDLASEVTLRGTLTLGFGGRLDQQIANAVRDPSIVALVNRLLATAVDFSFCEEIVALTGWSLRAVGRKKAAPFVFLDEDGAEMLTLRKARMSRQDSHKIAAKHFKVSVSRVRQIIDAEK